MLYTGSIDECTRMYIVYQYYKFIVESKSEAWFSNFFFILCLGFLRTLLKGLSHWIRSGWKLVGRYLECQVFQIFGGQFYFFGFYFIFIYARIDRWTLTSHYDCLHESCKHCNENPIDVFPKKELRGLSPNFHIHVSVSDLQSIFPESVHIFSCDRIGRPIVGIYKSLTDIWMWKLGLRPRNFFTGNTFFEFSV